jgi:hypothetical protein
MVLPRSHQHAWEDKDAASDPLRYWRDPAYKQRMGERERILQVKDLGCGGRASLPRMCIFQLGCDRRWQQLTGVCCNAKMRAASGLRWGLVGLAHISGFPLRKHALASLLWLWVR